MKKLVHACDFVLPVAGGARRVDSSEREVRFSGRNRMPAAKYHYELSVVLLLIERLVGCGKWRLCCCFCFLFFCRPRVRA